MPSAFLCCDTVLSNRAISNPNVEYKVVGVSHWMILLITEWPTWMWSLFDRYRIRIDLFVSYVTCTLFECFQKWGRGGIPIQFKYATIHLEIITIANNCMLKMNKYRPCLLNILLWILPIQKRQNSQGFVKN